MPITAQSLVVATGGLSIPKMGATAFGYNLARQFASLDHLSQLRRILTRERQRHLPHAWLHHALALND